MRFGAYQLRERFGAGGMGEVWIAEHVALRRPTAVKLIRPDQLGSQRAEQVLARFEREARATSALRSPHTIQIYDFGITDDGTFYYAMELLEGCSLETLVGRRGPVHPERVAWILAQACDSLHEAHLAGLVHRDVKPGNVHLCKLGLKYDFVKVLDFGLVKTPDSSTAADLQLTDDRSIPGTPAVMPPEVLGGASTLDARADIYSLGCVAYWLLTGTTVFAADSPLEMVMAHIDRTPVPPSQRVELRIPAALEALVLRCLEKNPNDRPQSAAEVARELAACDVGEPWTEERAETWWLTHNPQAWSRPTHRASSTADEPHPITPSGASAVKPSVAVLPFENPSGDPEQNFFSDGVAEDIIRELGRFRALVVISRRSSFALRDSDASVPEIARDLGARYVVQGSVRRFGDRIRLSVELTDGRSGNQLWAERYDRKLVDIFEVQTDVVQTIVSTLAGRVEAESLARAKRKPPTSLDAYECLLRGKEMHHRYNPDAAEEALEWFRRATDIEPELAVGYAWFACTAAQTNRWSGPSGELFDEATRAVGRAYELDPDEPEVHRLLASLHIYQGNHDKARFHQERALALNPNDERVVCQQGELHICLGEPDRAIDWIRRAMRLNPYHPPRWWGHLARALQLAGRCEESLAALERMPAPALAEHAFMAACCANLGRTDEANRHAADVLRLDPSFSVAAFVGGQQFARADDADRLAAALRAAGLPE